jgi:hypothetical protein
MPFGIGNRNFNHLMSQVDKTLRPVLGSISDASDWPAVRSALTGKVPDNVLPTLDLAVALSQHVGDVELPELEDLRRFALTYNPERLAALMPPPEDNKPDTRTATARELRTTLFRLQSSAVLQRMPLDKELPIADAEVRDGVAAAEDGMPRERRSVFAVRKQSK